MNKINKIVSNNIKKYRKERGISQNSLSSSIGISINKYILIEENKIKIEIPVLYKISIVLDISIDKFFNNEK